MVSSIIDLSLLLILSVLVTPTNYQAPPPTNVFVHSKRIGETSVRQGMFLNYKNFLSHKMIEKMSVYVQILLFDLEKIVSICL